VLTQISKVEPKHHFKIVWKSYRVTAPLKINPPMRLTG